MRTYPAEVIRVAMMSLIDCDKYVRFTMYLKNNRPVKIKAKITCVWCTPEGIRIEFHWVYWNRKKIFNIAILAKDIRWLTNPFDKEKFEAKCRELVPRLTTGSMLSSQGEVTVQCQKP